MQRSHGACLGAPDITVTLKGQTHGGQSAWYTRTASQWLSCLLNSTATFSPQLPAGQVAKLQKVPLCGSLGNQPDSSTGIPFPSKLGFSILNISHFPLKTFLLNLSSVFFNLTLPDLPSVLKLSENFAVAHSAHFLVVISPRVSGCLVCWNEKQSWEAGDASPATDENSERQPIIHLIPFKLSSGSKDTCPT